jgi:two-component system, chemotaxis family, chemotaxis protein CheY
MTTNRAAAPARDERNAGRASAARPQILVADADDDTRALYRSAFAALGFDVVEASDGRDALAKALSHPPALVVAETALPFLDGYALCEILRRDRATTAIPILVVTAESRPGQINRARQAGADLVLVKPTPLDQLSNEVMRLVTPGEIDPPTTSTEAAPLVESASPGRRKAQAKALLRVSATPALRCPSCADPLIYLESHVGGVSARNPEQWDDFCCRRCGLFQFRQRTRKLRRVSN